MNWILKHRKLILVILAALVILFLAPKLSTLSVEEIVSYTPSQPLLAAAVLIGLYCLKSFLLAIPVIVLYISAGIMFPTGWAILISVIGLTAELLINYYAGRYLGRERIEGYMKKGGKITKFLNFAEVNSSSACFFSRMLPISSDLFSMFFGAVNVPLVKYILYSLLGFASGMIPWVLAGTAIENPLSVEFILPFAICFVVFAGAFIILQKITKTKNTRE